MRYGTYSSISFPSIFPHPSQLLMQNDTCSYISFPSTFVSHFFFQFFYLFVNFGLPSCLKLYCQCFAASTTCGPKCKCDECHNTTRHADYIASARKGILQRNSAAFDVKVVTTVTPIVPSSLLPPLPPPPTPPPTQRIVSSSNWSSQNKNIPYNHRDNHPDPQSYTLSYSSPPPSNLSNGGQQRLQHHHHHPSTTIVPQFFHQAQQHRISRQGCKCRRSFCLKKYCECFQNGTACGIHCRCIDCKNTNLFDKYNNKKGGSKGSIAVGSLVSNESAIRLSRHVVEPWRGKKYDSSKITNSKRSLNDAGDMIDIQNEGFEKGRLDREIPNKDADAEQKCHFEEKKEDYTTDVAISTTLAKSEPDRMAIMAAVAMTELLNGYSYRDPPKIQDKSLDESSHEKEVENDVDEQHTSSSSVGISPENYRYKEIDSDSLNEASNDERIQDSANDNTNLVSSDHSNEEKADSPPPVLFSTQSPLKRKLNQEPEVETTEEAGDVHPSKEMKRSPISSSSASLASVESRNPSPVLTYRSSPQQHYTSDYYNRRPQPSTPKRFPWTDQQQPGPPTYSYFHDRRSYSNQLPPQHYYPGVASDPRRSPVQYYRPPPSSQYKHFPMQPQSPSSTYLAHPPRVSPPPLPPSHFSSSPSIMYRPLPSNRPDAPTLPSPQVGSQSESNRLCFTGKSYEEIIRTTGLPKSLSFRKICSRCGKTRGEHGELGFGNKCVFQDCGKCGAGFHWHELAKQPMGVLCQLTTKQGALPGAAAIYDRKIKDLASRADMQKSIHAQESEAHGVGMNQYNYQNAVISPSSLCLTK